MVTAHYVVVGASGGTRLQISSAPEPPARCSTRSATVRIGNVSSPISPPGSTSTTGRSWSRSSRPSDQVPTGSTQELEADQAPRSPSGAHGRGDSGVRPSSPLPVDRLTVAKEAAGRTVLGKDAGRCARSHPGKFVDACLGALFLSGARPPPGPVGRRCPGPGHLGPGPHPTLGSPIPPGTHPGSEPWPRQSPRRSPLRRSAPHSFPFPRRSPKYLHRSILRSQVPTVERRCRPRSQTIPTHHRTIELLVENHLERSAIRHSLLPQSA